MRNACPVFPEKPSSQKRLREISAFWLLNNVILRCTLLGTLEFFFPSPKCYLLKLLKKAFRGDPVGVFVPARPPGKAGASLPSRSWKHSHSSLTVVAGLVANQESYLCLLSCLAQLSCTWVTPLTSMKLLNDKILALPVCCFLLRCHPVNGLLCKSHLTVCVSNMLWELEKPLRQRFKMGSHGNSLLLLN